MEYLIVYVISTLISGLIVAWFTQDELMTAATFLVPWFAIPAFLIVWISGVIVGLMKKIRS